MGWKHYQTADYPKREPQVGSGLFGIRLLILHFKFQFTKSIKSSTFHIPLILIYPLRKHISFQKCPKNTQKFTQNRLTVVNVMSIEIQRCLKRDRDVGRKAVLSHVKTAFTCTPALNRSLSENSGCKQFQVQRYREQHELNTLAKFGHEKCQFTTAEDRNKLSSKTRLHLVGVEQILPQASK